jgi:hypothetical protein
VRRLLERLLFQALTAAQRRLLGISPDEIRYTFEDVRAELRATRTELLAELAGLRRELDDLAGRGREDDDGPVAEA